jgi:hypothetical protein
MANLTGWTKAPILAYRVLQDPGAYADTLTLRFNLKTAVGPADATEAQLRLRDPTKKPYLEMPELVVGVIHQRVFEAFWGNGETCTLYAAAASCCSPCCCQPPPLPTPTSTHSNTPPRRASEYASVVALQ